MHFPSCHKVHPTWCFSQCDIVTFFVMFIRFWCRSLNPLFKNLAFKLYISSLVPQVFICGKNVNDPQLASSVLNVDLNWKCTLNKDSENNRYMGNSSYLRLDAAGWGYSNSFADPTTKPFFASSYLKYYGRLFLHNPPLELCYLYEDGILKFVHVSRQYLETR